MNTVTMKSRSLFQILFQEKIEIGNNMVLTLKEYLHSLGENVLTNPKRLEEEKIRYKQIYMKSYRESYNKNNKRIKITFSNGEYQQISKLANESKKPLASYVKSCLYAYINKEFLIPDEGKLKDFRFLLLNISNNINQVARWGNENKRIESENIQYLYEQLRMIDKRINVIFKKPDDIQNLVRESIKDNPFLKKELLEILRDDGKLNKE